VRRAARRADRDKQHGIGCNVIGTGVPGSGIEICAAAATSLCTAAANMRRRGQR